jgi:hypothetical protein
MTYQMLWASERVAAWVFHSRLSLNPWAATAPRR